VRFWKISTMKLSSLILAAVVPTVAAKNKMNVQHQHSSKGGPGGVQIGGTFTTAQKNTWTYWDDAKYDTWKVAYAASMKAFTDACKGKCDAAKWDAKRGPNAATVVPEADESTCYCGRGKYCAVKFDACWNYDKDKDSVTVQDKKKADCQKAMDSPDPDCTDAEIGNMRQVKGCLDQKIERTEEHFEDDMDCEDYEDDCMKIDETLWVENEDDAYEEDYDWDGCGSVGVAVSWLFIVSMLFK